MRSILPRAPGAPRGRHSRLRLRQGWRRYPGEDGLILAGGLLADEFIHSTTPPSQQEVDQRTTATINPTLSDVYRNLHQARTGLENAAEALRQFLMHPDDSPDIAETQSLAGFTYVYFGETFCSGVPFSRVSGDSLVFGGPETTTQMFERGLAAFDSALAEPGLVRGRRNYHESCLCRAGACAAQPGPFC